LENLKMGNYFSKQPGSRIIKAQNIALTGNAASTPSTDFTAQTYQIRCATTLAGWFRIGDNKADPTAVIGDTFIPTGVADYFAVSPGQRAAFISTSTSTGNFSLTEMA
jgi:hypothetical protein